LKFIENQWREKKIEKVDSLNLILLLLLLLLFKVIPAVIHLTVVHKKFRKKEKNELFFLLQVPVF